MVPNFVPNIAREYRSFGTENPHLVVVIAGRFTLARPEIPLDENAVSRELKEFPELT